MQFRPVVRVSGSSVALGKLLRSKFYRTPYHQYRLIALLFLGLLLIVRLSHPNVNFYTDAPCTEPMRRALHSTHSIPVRLLELLSDEEQAELFDAITRDAASSPRKILALHLTSSSRVSRLRTLAAALPYVRATSRTLLVLWDTYTNDPEKRIYAAPKLLPNCSHDVVVKSVDGFLAPKGGQGHSDWADLTVAWLERTTGLDQVVPLANKHLYVLVSGDDGHGLDGVKFASYAFGVYDFPTCFRIGNAAVQTPSPDQLPTVSEDKLDEQAGDEKEEPSSWSWPFGKRATNSLADLRLLHAFTVAFESRLLTKLKTGDVHWELNVKYEVPSVFLAGLTNRRQRQLLYELRRSKSGRAIFVHTQYGLGNRLRALGSALALAEETKRVLVVIWVADVHLDCEFSDLFSNDDIIVMPKLDGLIWPPTDIRPYERALSSVDFYNMMKLDGANGTAPVHDSQIVNADPRDGRHMYVKTAYVVKSKYVPGIVRVSSPYWARLRKVLNPVVSVATYIARPDLSKVGKGVGIHIRGRTLDNDIAGLSGKAYGAGASQTDMWRRMTGVETFAAKMRKMPSSYVYFVAADQQEAITALRDEFGAARILSLPGDAGSCDSRNKECARLALADILLLAKVKVLLGSRKC